MIKDNLVMLRKYYGYSQEEIAEKIGISRQAYGKWEKGDTIPDVEKCALLASVYGITVDGLIHTETLSQGTKVPPPPKGKHIFGTVTISERGQIVIPKQARDIFGIAGGDRIVILGDEEQGLALIKESIFAETLNRMMEMSGKECGDEEG